MFLRPQNWSRLKPITKALLPPSGLRGDNRTESLEREIFLREELREVPFCDLVVITNVPLGGFGGPLGGRSFSQRLLVLLPRRVVPSSFSNFSKLLGSGAESTTNRNRKSPRFSVRNVLVDGRQHNLWDCYFPETIAKESQLLAMFHRKAFWVGKTLKIAAIFPVRQWQSQKNRLTWCTQVRLVKRQTCYKPQ